MLHVISTMCGLTGKGQRAGPRHDQRGLRRSVVRGLQRFERAPPGTLQSSTSPPPLPTEDPKNPIHSEHHRGGAVVLLRGIGVKCRLC